MHISLNVTLNNILLFISEIPNYRAHKFTANLIGLWIKDKTDFFSLDSAQIYTSKLEDINTEKRVDKGARQE